MICPKCQKELPEDAKFCLECGTPLKSKESELENNEVKDYENSLTGLNYKQEYLNKSLDKSKDILSQYKNEMEQSVSTSRKYRDNLRYLEQQLEKNAQLGKEMLANGDGKGADKQAQIMKDLKEQLDKVNKEYQEHRQVRTALQF